MKFVLDNRTNFALTGFLTDSANPKTTIINPAPHQEIVIDNVTGDIAFSIHVVMNDSLHFPTSKVGSGMGLLYLDGAYLVKGYGCLNVLNCTDRFTDKWLIIVEPTD